MNTTENVEQKSYEPTCIPVSRDSKPKQSRRQKIDKLLASTRVPSALGASYFQLVRRFLAGKTPANELEERAFATLRRLSPDLQQVLACAGDSFDSLTNSDRDRLFGHDLLSNLDQPITVAGLTEAFAQEILDNVTLKVFDNAGCTTENPGKVRTPPPSNAEIQDPNIIVSRINGLRTYAFRPELKAGDYTPEELQQVCHIVLEGTEPKLVCEVQTPPCSGDQALGVCLRVQEIEAGQAVVLEGVNFSSVDTKVRLYTPPTLLDFRDLDAFVCGDNETPLTEIIDGTEVLIFDSRVHDRLTFRVPEDVPPGSYFFQVIANEDRPDDSLGSGTHTIAVVPSSTARFQIVSETLRCINETGSTSLGSDEVGIKILAVPLFLDLTGGELQIPNGGNPIRFGDVDSGDLRNMDHLLFSHEQPIVGAALSMMGFEIDGEEAFEKQIDNFTDAFIEVLKDELAFVLDHLKETEDIVKKLAEKGLTGAIAGAIALGVVLAIDVFVALWAPADLIIEDALGPSALELVQLTSVNFPLPAPSEHVTPQGIKVKVTPLDKIPQQYRERREYISDDEGSDYEIVLRYNRLA